MWEWDLGGWGGDSGHWYVTQTQLKIWRVTKHQNLSRSIVMQYKCWHDCWWTMSGMCVQSGSERVRTGSGRPDSPGRGRFSLGENLRSEASTVQFHPASASRHVWLINATQAKSSQWIHFCDSATVHVKPQSSSSRLQICSVFPKLAKLDSMVWNATDRSSQDKPSISKSTTSSTHRLSTQTAWCSCQATRAVQSLYIFKLKKKGGGGS